MKTRSAALLAAIVLAGLLPSVASSAALDAPSLRTSVPPLGSSHPTVPGMYYFGASGWGRLTFAPQPPKLATVLIATPWYSDSTSRSKAAWASSLLGYPIVPHSSWRVPDVVDGRHQICNYVHPHTGEIVLYEDGPCEHVNFWLRGPRNGFSYCIFKSCQTVGHGNQGGYSTFLAHSELWARIESVPQPPLVGFEPCGPICDAPVTTSTLPPATSVPPTSVPPTSVSPSSTTTAPPSAPDPCAGSGVDCTRPVCDPSGVCAPDCSGEPCPPPSPCAVGNPCDLPAQVSDLRVRVVVDAPEVFVARGTLQPQDVTVVDVVLLCGARPCGPGDEHVDLVSLRVSGTLDLSSTSPAYRECAALAPSSCTFRRTVLDRGQPLEEGDTVRTVFFSPTRSDEHLRVRVLEPSATVGVRAYVPVLEWRRTATTFTLVATGDSAWQDAGSLDVPVEVVTRSGTVVPASGLLRVVAGTTGRN